MNRLGRIIGAAISMLLAGLSLAQTDLSITRLQVTDEFGSEFQPEIGSRYFLTVDYTVSSGLSRTYRVLFSAGYKKLTTVVLSYGIQAPGEYRVTWGPFDVLSDREFTISAWIDSEKRIREASETNNFLEKTIAPIAPSIPIEFYDQQSLTGNMRLDASLKTSAVGGILTVLSPGINSTDSQIVDSETSTVLEILNTNKNQKFRASQQSLSSGMITVQSEFSILASAVRVNFDLLRAGRYPSFRNEIASAWLKPEYFVQSGHPEILAFAQRHLPVDYTTKLAPVEVAETLYRALLRTTSYSFKQGTAPDALKTLKSKKGDCGGLSSLYVALLRTVGIPARTVSGMTMGDNKWHVWAEFHLENIGWIPVDPAYAKGAMPKGDEPIYFGVIPDLNARAITMVGMDIDAAGYSAPMLQSPRLSWANSKVSATSQLSCQLRLR